MLVTAPRPKMKRSSATTPAASDKTPSNSVTGVTSFPPSGAGAWVAEWSVMIDSFVVTIITLRLAHKKYQRRQIGVVKPRLENSFRVLFDGNPAFALAANKV